MISETYSSILMLFDHSLGTDSIISYKDSIEYSIKPFEDRGDPEHPLHKKKKFGCSIASF